MGDRRSVVSLGGDSVLDTGHELFHRDAGPGIACASCHPEGRDDGHTWRELKGSTDKTSRLIAGPSIAPRDEGHYGMARQTPMLAGRVDAVGPYGWHGESPDIVARIKEGFDLHRAWDYPVDGKSQRMRAEPLVAFLRKGLVLPPRAEHDPTPEEQRGKEIFLSAKTQCATCHTPEKGYTDRSVVPLRGFKVRPMFDEDPQRGYKVPSLLFVAGTAPYYHDGSFQTLEELVNDNQDRMGHTVHLSPEDRAALISFLRTL